MQVLQYLGYTKGAIKAFVHRFSPADLKSRTYAHRVFSVTTVTLIVRGVPCVSTRALGSKPVCHQFLVIAFL